MGRRNTFGPKGFDRAIGARRHRPRAKRRRMDDIASSLDTDGRLAADQGRHGDIGGGTRRTCAQVAARIRARDRHRHQVVVRNTLSWARHALRDIDAVEVDLDGTPGFALPDDDTGADLVALPVPQMVSITGSTRAGMAVATSAAKDVKRTHLELGGKAPVIIFNDADIEAAVEGLTAAGYFNAGQDCTAATRMMIRDGI